MVKKKQVFVALVVLGLIVVLMGCNSMFGKKLPDEGVLKITISQKQTGVVPQTVSDRITLSKFVVTASKGNSTISQDVTYTGAATHEAFFENLVQGDWNISVVAKDIENYDCYGGSAVATVVEGLTTVEIPLYLVNGNLDATVKLPTLNGINISLGTLKLVNPFTGAHVTQNLTINGSTGLCDLGSVKAGTWFMEVELFDNTTKLAWGSGSMTVLPSRNNHALIEFTNTFTGGSLQIVVTINESPSDPTGLTATSSNGNVVLNWNPNPETNIAGYSIYRANSLTDFKQILSYTLVTGTTYTDTTAEAGTTYYYWVQAYDSNGYSSEFSEPCSINAVTATPITYDLSTYAAVLYVDGINGNDTTGNGTQLNPFKTLTTARQNVTAVKTAIYIISPGTYAAPNGLQKLLNNSAQLDYYVKPEIFGQVTFDLQKTEQDLNITMTQNNSFYGIIFTRSNSGDNRTYEYFYDNSTIKLRFYNCVFGPGPQLIAPSFPIFVNNSSPNSKTVYYNNCTFLPSFLWSDGLNQSSYGTFTNCTFVVNMVGSVKFTQDNFNLLGATFDSTYHVTSSGSVNTGTGLDPDGSIADMGVYGGPYAWGTWVK